MPEREAALFFSTVITWAVASAITSWPAWTKVRSAVWLAMVPVTVYRAASFPVSSAARSWRRLTVGSSPNQSSPTSASAMALRMAGDGLVTVSDRRSTRPIGRPAYYGSLKRVLSALDTPITVNERTCDRCGGQNRPDATYCWQCYATFGAAPVPEPIRAGRIGPAASIAGNGTSPVMTTAPPAPGAPTSTGTDWERWLVKGVVFVLGFAG